MSLKIKNLHISVGDKPIVKGVTLTIKPGEVHAIMGPNGSGKSTLANAIMGHPKYRITAGEIELDGADITAAKPEARARGGLFLSEQYPPEIAGVSTEHFLRLSANSLTGANRQPLEFHQELQAKMRTLGIDPEFARRSINVGFSGGEKKRAEILQLLVLNPKYAILDETDSGLDVDALRIVAEGINRYRSPERGILLITHYNRILEFVLPDVVHAMSRGVLVRSGGPELAREIETLGYQDL
ncbi:MAG: FeS assembly ATPase SufC [Candidatus Magasanikbacteria bacterium GW2011_GWA2_56_11]|uniref:FeS assembly ATPase SufC n=1 Tax=Candidatus Magasanikbacteria bacterium GW2011_GWA2_56_11 TaxID=1619044 RepID=A0A0G1YH19_9BACT|nr:MAG: FeS assembly ATPase SufC [Candidatus Magasanikbacteria bacterium GW2011_GWA2_56_11]